MDVKYPLSHGQESFITKLLCLPFTRHYRPAYIIMLILTVQCQSKITTIQIAFCGNLWCMHTQGFDKVKLMWVEQLLGPDSALAEKQIYKVTIFVESHQSRRQCD